MRGTLEGLSDDEDLTISFLRHVITVIWGFVREKDVYVEVQQHTIAEGPVVAFAGQLEDLSGWYIAIQNSESEKWNTYSDSACRALNAINLFDIVPMRPLVLAIARRFPEKLAVDAFKFLVSLSVRLMITNGTRTGSTEQGLADAAYKVFNASIASVPDMIAELKSITPTDAEFAQAFEAATVSNHRFARYYLRSLEMAAKAEPEPWHIPNDDADQINLEHVLPQKPGGNWPQFDFLIKRSSTVSGIGNLVLIRKSQNINIQNLPFATKRPILAQSPYNLSRTSRSQNERRRPSAVRATLDDPPIHIRPTVPAISGCKAKEPFRFRPLRHMQGGTAAFQSQRIFCRSRQESAGKRLTSQIGTASDWTVAEIATRQKILAGTRPQDVAGLMDLAGDYRLREAVESLHHCRAMLVQKAPVRETFRGQAVWEGVVHVFGLEGHPEATRAYAWSSPIEGSEKQQIAAVVQVGAIRTPLDAARAAIVAEHRESF